MEGMVGGGGIKEKRRGPCHGKSMANRGKSLICMCITTNLLLPNMLLLTYCYIPNLLLPNLLLPNLLNTA